MEFLFLFIEGERILIIEPLRMEREDFNANRSTTATEQSAVECAHSYALTGECGCISLFLDLLLLEPSQTEPMFICHLGTQRL